MLGQLATLREQIEAQSFQLGRSESAVTVMHNVRNALNPGGTVLSQGLTQAPPVDRATLDRALAEHQRELQVGREAMAHALEIIGQQQRQAHERPALESCDVAELVARNMGIARYAAGVEVTVAFPGDRHLVFAIRVILGQVIGNLLGAAAEAIAATDRAAGDVKISVLEADGASEIRIADDGEGFDSERSDALFRRGFSTRARKSGGLGLHWCANSITAVDGALRLESEGRGRGATAVLTLRTAHQLAAAA